MGSLFSTPPIAFGMFDVDYEDLKASKHETIEECFQKALKKTRKRMRQNKHPEI
jgi:hypothetical protein